MKKHLLTAVAAMFAFVLTVSASVCVYAEHKEIGNVNVSGEGILTWDFYDGATRYWITFGTASFEPEGNSADLAKYAREYNFPSGVYSFSIVACDDNWQNLSLYSTGSYEYTAPIGLDEVKNMRWDGKTARWDPVADAIGYNLYLFVGENNVGVYYVEDVSLDFSGSTAFELGNEYRFSVMAIAEGDKANGPLTGYSDAIQGWFEHKDIQNVRIEEGLLSWDPYDGATRYWLILSTGGAYEPEGTSINLSKLIGSGGVEGETYSFDLVACLDDWTNISKHYYGTYVFRKEDLPPVYTINVKVQGRGTAAADPASGSDGTVVTVTATPDSGYVFKMWKRASGMISGGLEVPGATSAVTSFTISGFNVELIAVFEPEKEETASSPQDSATVTGEETTSADEQSVPEESSEESLPPETGNATDTAESTSSGTEEAENSETRKPSRPAETGKPEENKSEVEVNGLKTALIIVSSVLGVVIAGAVVFCVWFFVNRKRTK